MANADPFSAADELIMCRSVTMNSQIDGMHHVVLRFVHPRLGNLDFLLALQHAQELVASLSKTIEDVTNQRIAKAKQMLGG